MTKVYLIAVIVLFNASLNCIGQSLFTLVSPEKSTIRFENQIIEDGKTNLLNYEYLYNGGGVAIGDFNNDGLADIYFTGSAVPNKLYLNKGNWVFEDISKRAGVETEFGLSTGVTLVDINNDGFLDIYICKSASTNPLHRKNILYVNNKDLTFTDRAKEYGLADMSYSTQSYFTDFDLDGDLDMYLVNHPGSMRDAKMVYLTYNKLGQLVLDKDTAIEYVTDRYYENINGKYVDKTIKAGVVDHGYGLSAAVGDYNNDGYPDIYVCNDYIKPDFLYINNKNGTFTNQFNQYFKHSSTSSMGSDYADINNDGFLDLFTLDMLAEDYKRQKQLKTGSNYDHFFKNIKYGLEYQYTKNCLQVNNGNGSFSEISYFSGLAFTDWSWAPIMADFDLDGLKDIYITNGYLRDVTDMDYVKFKADSVVKQLKNAKNPDDISKLFSAIPSVKVSNYFFKNNGYLMFSNLTVPSGVSRPSWSNGAAMGDLDNDGDLDIVVNNFFEPAFLYQNNAIESKFGNYLKIKLNGSDQNKQAIGAIVYVTTPDGVTQTLHQMPSRGYLSTHDATFVVGLGKNMQADIRVVWPGAKTQTVVKSEANTSVTISQENTKPYSIPSKPLTVFQDITRQIGLSYKHEENEYIDFKLEPLLPRQLSKLGPGLDVADANGDGLEDFVTTGAKGFETVLYLQTSQGKFVKSNQPALATDKIYEDVASQWSDIDQDGDMDLFIVSGGNENPKNPEMYPLRLYINDGKGNLTRSTNAIPSSVLTSANKIALGDMDKDGDYDLFVGGRVVPGHYGLIPKSFILQNNNGIFTDVSSQVASISKLGMITDATWSDCNKDGWLDLVIVGDWMPLTIYKNNTGKLDNTPIVFEKTYGWWNTIHVTDLDKDGDEDLVMGNLGLNNRYRGNDQTPMTMEVSDFDNNGSTDCVISTFQNGVSTPLVTRDNMLDQMVYLKKKFLRYSTYANATIQDIFTPSQLAKATHFKANNMLSQVAINDGNFNFTFSYLPKEAQFFSVKSILSEDVNQDGIMDLLLAGNEYATEVETGRIDAGIGLYLKGKGGNKFQAETVLNSGFYLPEDVKQVKRIKIANQNCYIAVRNSESILFLKK